MKFGLNKDQYMFIANNVVAPLEARGAKVWCYGSRARGDNKQFSDLDLMIESNVDLGRLVSKIQEQLTNSNFPFKVDLVEFKDFAESYKPGYERDKIEFR